MFEGVQYLAIEGVIGVGKTNLTHVLAEKFNAGEMLEKYEENPFLDSYYKNREKYAFQTQIWFLLSRYRQIQEHLSQRNLFYNTFISDFMFEKDSIFANISLCQEELALYNTIANVIKKNTIVPDYVIYLQASTSVLMERIASRGRPFEKYINEEYIDNLNQAYNHYFFHYDKSPLLVINTDKINLQDEEEDIKEIVIQIEKHYKKGGTIYYTPMAK